MWNAIFRTSRNQAFSFPVCLPVHTKSSACVCILDAHVRSTIAYHARVAEPPLPRESTFTEAQNPTVIAQVTSRANRPTVWLMVHPSASSLDSESSVNLLFLPGLWSVTPTLTMAWLVVYSFSSLQQNQRRTLETCKLPLTDAPDC